MLTGGAWRVWFLGSGDTSTPIGRGAVNCVQENNLETIGVCCVLLVCGVCFLLKGPTGGRYGCVVQMPGSATPGSPQGKSGGGGESGRAARPFDLQRDTFFIQLFVRFDVAVMLHCCSCC